MKVERVADRVPIEAQTPGEVFECDNEIYLVVEKDSENIKQDGVYEFPCVHLRTGRLDLFRRGVLVRPQKNAVLNGIS